MLGIWILGYANRINNMFNASDLSNRLSRLNAHIDIPTSNAQYNGELQFIVFDYYYYRFGCVRRTTTLLLKMVYNVLFSAVRQQSVRCGLRMHIM